MQLRTGRGVVLSPPAPLLMSAPSSTMLSRVYVLLAVLAVVPATLALKCYQCGDLAALSGIFDLGNTGLGDIFSSSIGKKVMPPCTEFDMANPDKRFEAECPNSLSVPGLKPGCAKTKIGDMTIRMCQAAIPHEGCHARGEVSACYCAGNLCNGAGLAAPGLA